MINTLIESIRNGDCAIAPTDTVYGLIADASNPNAIAKLYQTKQRPATQPLQILVNSYEMARRLATFSPMADKIANNFWPGSITLILPRRADAIICPQSCGDQHTIGLRYPNSLLIQQLITKLDTPLAASSVNLRGEPPLTNADSIRTTFPNLAFAEGKTTSLASTIVEISDNQLTIHRVGSISQQQIEDCIAS